MLFNNFDVQLLCIIFLFIMFFSIRKNSDLDKSTLRLFAVLVFSTALAAMADSFRWIANKNHCAAYLAYALYYIFIPIPSLAALYLSSYLSKGGEMLSKRRMFTGIAVYAGMFILNIVNLVVPCLFYLDENNTFQRGPLNIAYNICVILILVLTIFRVYKDKSEYILKILRLQLFWLAPVITGIIQLVFDDVDIYIAGLTISIFIYYISLQAKTLRLDYLTGAFNRRYFDAMILQKMRQADFSLILVDVDNFKHINDHYGHVVGDEVLISVASLLKVSVHKNDTVARYGGDEFVVIIDSNDPNVLKIVTHRIQSMIDKFNTSSAYPFPISISMGYDIYLPGTYKNAREFIEHIDMLMYLEKKKSETHQLSLTDDHEPKQ